MKEEWEEEEECRPVYNEEYSYKAFNKQKSLLILLQLEQESQFCIVYSAADQEKLLVKR